jgi:hypothetical protein
MENDEIITYPPPIYERYTIPVHELDALAKGTPIPLYFNLSIFFLSLSGSLLGSVLVTISEKGFTNSSTVTIILFIIACLLFLLGAILLFKWIRLSKETNELLAEIKNRVPKNTKSSGNIITTSLDNLGSTQENIIK